jgi:hypothetical protein
MSSNGLPVASSDALDELSAPEPVQRELSMQLEALRSRFVLVKPAAAPAASKSERRPLGDRRLW